MVTGLGRDVRSTWETALKGDSGIERLAFPSVDRWSVRIGAPVKDWQPEKELDPRTARRTDRHQQFALVAAQQAMKQSGLQITDENRDRVSVLVAASTGGFLTYDENMVALQEHGLRRLNPFGIMMVLVNGAAAMISIEYGAQGPSYAIVSACATGADNIGQAAQMIRAGVIDAAIAGSSETPLTEMGIACLDRINTLSHRNDTPQTACAPFDRDRDGLVLGEGAGIVVIEALEHAQARGATILAELIGYGASADAHHLTTPDESGSGGARAIKRAIEDAAIDPSEINYVNAHGTATRLNDVIETRCYKLAFGKAAYKVPISSTKPLTGHAMGATAAIEAIFCIQAIREGAIPPTMNLRNPDPECDLDYTPLELRRTRVDTALTNSLGLGGHNAALIFRTFA
jgi:beta-ketoacyl-acyl-carrier-protein synthase II